HERRFWTLSTYFFKSDGKPSHSKIFGFVLVFSGTMDKAASSRRIPRASGKQVFYKIRFCV
ncbi:MAG: hypothetical protein IJQ39_05345, partial [Thermoguttaceae bacterium]|nr:hypothetical protein [Thermoguttaceae bacterium]